MTELAPYAVSEANSRGRQVAEAPPLARGEFQRDRDRIVHCTAFRRLEYKTQVFVNHEGDLFRTRLTHSIEVAQITRSIARALQLNEDLAEAVALSHDLGHTPFGHAGQEALNSCMKDFGGFEHNLQSLRTVDLLEESYAEFNGLNLMHETREGILKHCSPKHAAELGEIGRRFLEGRQPSLEAQLANLADEIAYNNHDIDDGLKAGHLSLAMLEEVDLWRQVSSGVRGKYPAIDDRRLVYQTISALIGLQLTDLCAMIESNLERLGIVTTDDLRLVNSCVAQFSDDIITRNAELKRFLFEKLYRHHKVDKMRVKAEIVITRLFETYLRFPNLLPPKYQARYQRCGLQRVVCDYIAGMTDRFAMDEYRRLFEPYERM